MKVVKNKVFSDVNNACYEDATGKVFCWMNISVMMERGATIIDRTVTAIMIEWRMRYENS